jgi:hypothetical protein
MVDNDTYIHEKGVFMNAFFAMKVRWHHNLLVFSWFLCWNKSYVLSYARNILSSNHTRTIITYNNIFLSVSDSEITKGPLATSLTRVTSALLLWFSNFYPNKFVAPTKHIHKPWYIVERLWYNIIGYTCTKQ